MADVSKDTEKKISQLQMMEQNLQGFLQQRQKVQSDLVEVESALSEIEKTDTAYKIVGNLMINASKEDLQKDLKEKQEMLELKLKALEKQEERLKERAQATQKEVLDEMKDKDNK